MSLLYLHGPRPSTPLLDHVQTAVSHDGEPPALERAIAVVPLQAAVSIPQCLLDSVLRVGVIPDLDRRVVDFLRNQADLEGWRSRRYSAEAQALVAEATADGARLGTQGVSREQAFRELRETREEIGRHL